ASARRPRWFRRGWRRSGCGHARLPDRATKRRPDRPVPNRPRARSWLAAFLLRPEVLAQCLGDERAKQTSLLETAQTHAAPEMLRNTSVQVDQGLAALAGRCSQACAARYHGHG